MPLGVDTDVCNSETCQFGQLRPALQPPLTPCRPKQSTRLFVSVLQFIIGEICSEHTMRPGRYRLGLVRFKIMLLGTSRSRYPMKKMDTARE